MNGNKFSAGMFVLECCQNCQQLVSIFISFNHHGYETLIHFLHQQVNPFSHSVCMF